MIFMLKNLRTGEVLYAAKGYKSVRDWGIRNGFIKVEKTQNFRHIDMGDCDILVAR